MRRLLEQLLVEVREIHVPLKELPSSLRDALKRVNYHAQDVGVVAQDKVIPNPYAGEGQKGFVLVIDINTGKSRDLPGGWGGANYNDPREIDFAGKAVSIPAGGAIIIGTEGHPRTMATIYVNPEMIAAMLPAGPEVSDRDKMILRSIRSYTSAGRKEIFRDQKVKPEEVDALVGRGLLKKTKSGALSITTDGKNMAEGDNTMRSLLNRLEESTRRSLDESVRVDTTYYESNHGGKPRGTGFWAFSFDKKDVPHDEVFMVNQSKYSDAVKKAKSEAKSRGATVIYLQP